MGDDQFVSRTRTRVGGPWTTASESARLPRLYPDDAEVADEPAGLDARFRKWAGSRDAAPKLWMDAYLAAFAHSGGHRLVTIDRAFRQFVGLDLELLGG